MHIESALVPLLLQYHVVSRSKRLVCSCLGCLCLVHLATVYAIKGLQCQCKYKTADCEVLPVIMSFELLVGKATGNTRIVVNKFTPCPLQAMQWLPKKAKVVRDAGISLVVIEERLMLNYATYTGTLGSTRLKQGSAKTSRAYQSVQPCGNKLLQQKWDQKYYDEHRRLVNILLIYKRKIFWQLQLFVVYHR